MLEINKEKFKTGSEMPKFSACGGPFLPRTYKYNYHIEIRLRRAEYYIVSINAEQKRIILFAKLYFVSRTRSAEPLLIQLVQSINALYSSENDIFINIQNVDQNFNKIPLVYNPPCYRHLKTRGVVFGIDLMFKRISTREIQRGLLRRRLLGRPGGCIITITPKVHLPFRLRAKIFRFSSRFTLVLICTKSDKQTLWGWD